MNQLGDLEKILSAAKEIGENFQKELSNLREENDLLKIEIEDIRNENKILREENEKIYLEMHNLRDAKEEIRNANETFSTNMNHLVTQLEENHQKTMAQMNQILSTGLQNFIVEYVKKLSAIENISDVNNSDANISDANNADENISDENISDENLSQINLSDDDGDIEIQEKYSDETMALENIETAVAPNNGSKKNKMQYAAFYAEEVGAEKDAADNNSKNRYR